MRLDKLEAGTAGVNRAEQQNPNTAERFSASNVHRGIGARLERKEDARLLYGLGKFVGDIALPGTLEVAFVRSPVAHARLRSIGIPEQHRSTIFTAESMGKAVKPIRTPSGISGFKLSDYPVLAGDKVRMVGEPIAMCVAATRAQAEDLCQLVTLDLEELPAVVDSLRARTDNTSLVHEHFGDNMFLTTDTDINFNASVTGATVKRE